MLKVHPRTFTRLIPVALDPELQQAVYSIQDIHRAKDKVVKPYRLGKVIWMSLS